MKRKIEHRRKEIHGNRLLIIIRPQRSNIQNDGISIDAVKCDTVRRSNEKYLEQLFRLPKMVSKKMNNVANGKTIMLNSIIKEIQQRTSKSHSHDGELNTDSQNEQI